MFNFKSSEQIRQKPKLHNFSEVAKELGYKKVGRNILLEYLRYKEQLDWNNYPVETSEIGVYYELIGEGFFKTTLITEAGLKHIRQICEEGIEGFMAERIPPKRRSFYKNYGYDL